MHITADMLPEDELRRVRAQLLDPSERFEDWFRKQMLIEVDDALCKFDPNHLNQAARP